MEQRQAPFRVETGALDDGRNRGRQVVIGILGWVLVVALIVWLALKADEVEVRVTLFLLFAAVVIALLWTSVAVELFRPLLIRARRRHPAPVSTDALHDALGRAIDPDGAAELTGEFSIEEDGGVRRYLPAARLL